MRPALPYARFGLLIFQSLFMKDMMGGSYVAALKHSLLPEWVSMNCMMAGMFPTMVVLMIGREQQMLLRFIGSNNNLVHPMHIHGGPFEVVARDGQTIQPSARYLADTVNVGPGQRYDVIWTAREVGKWLIHCHIPHHTTNNNVEEQGAGMIINITPYHC